MFEWMAINFAISPVKSYATFRLQRLKLDAAKLAKVINSCSTNEDLQTANEIIKSTGMDKEKSVEGMSVHQKLKDAGGIEEALTELEKLEIPKELKLEPRSTYLHMGAVSSVKGSVYMEYGNTKVLATIAPPREMTHQTKKAVNLGMVVCEVKYAASTLADPLTLPLIESNMSAAIRKALEPVLCRAELPNCQLDVNVLVLDDDGCVLCTAINCCGAALVKAGLPIYDIVTASTVCLFKGHVFVNPNASVERLMMSEGGANSEEEYGTVTIASLTNLDQVAGVTQNGYLSQKSFNTLGQHSLTINQHMHVIVNKALVKMVTIRHQIKDEMVEIDQTTLTKM